MIRTIINYNNIISYSNINNAQKSRKNLILIITNKI